MRLHLRVATASVLAVTATVVVAPHPGYTGQAKRVAWSAYDTAAVKTVTASCDPGEVVIGAGGRVRDGGGGVRLDAIRPGATSVTVRAAVLDEYPQAWSVAAAAICVPEPDGALAPVVVTSPAGSPTAACPGGTFLSGTGFDLPGKRVLTGLVPAADGTSVTVWSPAADNTDAPVAYAVCAAPPIPFYPARAVAEGRIKTETATVVTVDMTGDFRAWSISGVGAKVTAGPLREVPSSYPTVFIDAMMPDGAASATAEAVRRWSAPAAASEATAATATTTASPAAASEAAGVGGAAVDDPADDWELVVYGTDHDVY